MGTRPTQARRASSAKHEFWRLHRRTRLVAAGTQSCQPYRGAAWARLRIAARSYSHSMVFMRGSPSGGRGAGGTGLPLPPLHKNRHTWILSAGKLRQRIDSAKELSEALGHATIHYFREPCELATPDSPCLCQIDPFATAAQAGVRLDIGDKHDMWDYLFILDEPARDFYPYEKRRIAGLGSANHYPNEHLTIPGSDSPIR